jgi:NADP-dependent 3-hydroxy acid dehydrogenase YdfG
MDYNVVFAGRRADMLRCGRSPCVGDATSRCLAVPTDVKESAILSALFTKTKEHFAGWTLLFNNAGIGTTADLRSKTFPSRNGKCR